MTNVHTAAFRMMQDGLNIAAEAPVLSTAWMGVPGHKLELDFAHDCPWYDECGEFPALTIVFNPDKASVLYRDGSIADSGNAEITVIDVDYCDPGMIEKLVAAVKQWYMNIGIMDNIWSRLAKGDPDELFTFID